MAPFVRRPFLFISPLVGLGILLAQGYHDLFIYGIGLILSLLVLAFLALLRLSSFVGTMFLILGFICLGATALELSRDLPIEQEEDMVALLKVDEIEPPGDEWRKTLVTIRKKVVSGKVSDEPERMMLLLQAPEVDMGDVLLVRMEALPIKNRCNPGEFDAEAYWEHRNIYRMAFVGEQDYRLVGIEEVGILQQFWADVRENCTAVLRRNLDAKTLPVARALILGDKSQLSGEDRASFSNAGAMHVLAVSGLHVGIVVYLLMFLFERMPRVFTRTQASILALVIVWVYAGVTGLSPSVQRAAFMFSLLVLGQLLGRKGDNMNVLFFSGFVLLVLDPMLVFDIGFQLSYLAMIGIFTLYRPIAGLFFVRNKWMRKLWEGTAVGLAAQLFTVPLSLYYFHQFPNYFMLSNLMVMLLAAFILGIGLLLFAVQSIAFLAKWIGLLLGFLLLVLLLTMQFVERLPGAVATGFEVHYVWVLAAYLALILLLIARHKRWTLFVFGAAALFLLFQLQWKRFENWKCSELVVFNERQLVFSIKMEGQITCFYVHNERCRMQAERLMNDYSRIYPGNLNFVPLKPGVTTTRLGGEKVSCSMRKGEVLVNCGSKLVQVRTSLQTHLNNEYLSIDMAYLPQKDGVKNLMNGAIRLSLPPINRSYLD